MSTCNLFLRKVTAGVKRLLTDPPESPRVISGAMRGGQKKRYKDVLKANLKKCNIDCDSWEETAEDRFLWRYSIREGTAILESKRSEDLEEKRRRRKERQQQPRQALPPRNGMSSLQSTVSSKNWPYKSPTNTSMKIFENENARRSSSSTLRDCHDDD